MPVVFAVLLMAGCTRECLENKNSIGLAGFYDSETGRKISVQGLTVYGAGAPNDSVIVENGQSASQVYLPMSINRNMIQFIFHYTQKEIEDIRYNDTLTVNYTPVPYFASKECGAMYMYEIQDFSCTTHLMDSVAIPVMKITNKDIETIKLFMRTASADK